MCASSLYYLLLMTNILDFNHVSNAAVGFGPGKNETENRHASTYRTSVFGDGFDDNDPFIWRKKCANVPAKKCVFKELLQHSAKVP